MMIGLILIILLSLTIWVWMITDFMKRPNDNFAIGEKDAKIICIFIIFFTGLVGDIDLFIRDQN